MENLRMYSILLLAYAGMVAGLYFFKVGGDSFPSIAIAVNYISLLTALFFGYKSVKHFGLGSLQGKSLFFIFLALVMWLLGDIFWDLSGDAVVSLGDIFYYSYYPLVAVGIILGVQIASPDFFRGPKRLLLLAGTFVIASFLYFNYFPLSWDSSVDFITNAATHGYNIADFLLLLCIILILSLALSGIYSRVWMAAGAGALFFWMGDVMYALTYDTYVSGSAIEVLWIYGILCFAWAFILSTHHAQAALSRLEQALKNK
jgi:hypothetical protein